MEGTTRVRQDVGPTLECEKKFQTDPREEKLSALDTLDGDRFEDGDLEQNRNGPIKDFIWKAHHRFSKIASGSLVPQPLFISCLHHYYYKRLIPYSPL